MMWTRLQSSLIAAVICAGGGVLFYVLHAPLPWMMGSLSAAALTAILGGRWLLPAPLRVAARPVVGVLTGSAFGVETLAAMITWSDAILLVIAQSLLVTLLGYMFFRTLGGFDRQTAFFSATPGGVGEMAILGDALGGNARIIVTTHLMRIMVVVFSVPFIAQLVVGHPIGRILPGSAAGASPLLFDWIVLGLCAFGGYGLARAVKLPGGLVIGPMLLSIAVHAAGITQAAPPTWLVTSVQIVIGGVVGARFAGIDWREMRRTLVCAVVWAVTLIAITAASAWVSAQFVERSFLAMLLALSPGGMVEMTILTLSIGFEVAFVVTCQIFRILFVLLIGPLLFSVVSARTNAVDSPCERSAASRD